MSFQIAYRNLQGATEEELQQGLSTFREMYEDLAKKAAIETDPVKLKALKSIANHVSDEIKAHQVRLVTDYNVQT